MRHLRKRHRLNRPQDQRKALLRSLATELIMHGEIVTTLAKAKGLKPYAEKLVTKAKQGDLHSRRTAVRYLYDRVTGGMMDAETKKVISLEDIDENGKVKETGSKVMAETVLRKLFGPIAEQYQDRNGGYIRIYKLPPRRGDAAPMALVQFV